MRVEQWMEQIEVLTSYAETTYQGTIGDPYERSGNSPTELTSVGDSDYDRDSSTEVPEEMLTIWRPGPHEDATSGELRLQFPPPLSRGVKPKLMSRPHLDCFFSTKPAASDLGASDLRHGHSLLE